MKRSDEHTTCGSNQYVLVVHPISLSPPGLCLRATPQQRPSTSLPTSRRTPVTRAHATLTTAPDPDHPERRYLYRHPGCEGRDHDDVVVIPHGPSNAGRPTRAHRQSKGAASPEVHREGPRPWQGEDGGPNLPPTSGHNGLRSPGTSRAAPTDRPPQGRPDPPPGGPDAPRGHGRSRPPRPHGANARQAKGSTSGSRPPATPGGHVPQTRQAADASRMRSGQRRRDTDLHHQPVTPHPGNPGERPVGDAHHWEAQVTTDRCPGHGTSRTRYPNS